MKIGLVFVVALPALQLSANAFAQGSRPTPDYIEQRVGDDQVVTFPGDDLVGDGDPVYGALVRSPPRIMKCLLIRPRLNFVSQLLKSVENL